MNLRFIRLLLTAVKLALISGTRFNLFINASIIILSDVLEVVCSKDNWLHTHAKPSLGDRRREFCPETGRPFAAGLLTHGVHSFLKGRIIHGSC